MGSCNVDKIANNVRLLAFLVSGISAFPVASACQVSSLCAKRSFPWRSAYQLHCSLIFIFIFMLLITGDSNVKSSVPILFHSMGQWVLGVCVGGLWQLRDRTYTTTCIPTLEATCFQLWDFSTEILLFVSLVFCGFLGSYRSPRDILQSLSPFWVEFILFFRFGFLKITF